MISFSELFRKKLLFVTGKGGVGKTITASALALQAAQDGLRVCLVQSQPFDQISPLFGRPESKVSSQHTELKPNIYLMNLDLAVNLKAFMLAHMGTDKLYNTFMDNKVMKTFLESVPGLEQVALLGHICDLARRQQSYDLVIVDSYASGHYLSLMATPKSLLDTQLGGRLVQMVEHIYNDLANPDLCGTVVVALPESLVINETVELVDKIKALGVGKVLSVFLNRAVTDSRGGDSLAHIENQWVRSFLEQKKQDVQASLDVIAKYWGGSHNACAELVDCGYIREPLVADFPQLLFNHS